MKKNDRLRFAGTTEWPKMAKIERRSNTNRKVKFKDVNVEFFILFYLNILNSR